METELKSARTKLGEIAKAKAAAATKAKVGSAKTPEAVANSMKKLAAQVTTLLKKPAATTVLKKPAALPRPTPEMSDVFANMKKDRLRLSYGAFTSRAYDNAKRRGAKLGWSTDQCKQFARMNFDKATRIWNTCA